MSEPFVGEIRLFGFNFVPNGWAACDGQLLPIYQFNVLFSLLGKRYGGDGTTTFALPDLGDRVPIHRGPNFPIGLRAGEASRTLTPDQLPPHHHAVRASGVAGLGESPPGYPAAGGHYGGGGPQATLKDDLVPRVGGSQSFPLLQPSLTFTFCIALVGIYPPRP